MFDTLEPQGPSPVLLRVGEFLTVPLLLRGPHPFIRVPDAQTPDAHPELQRGLMKTAEELELGPITSAGDILFRLVHGRRCVHFAVWSFESSKKSSEQSVRSPSVVRGSLGRTMTFGDQRIPSTQSFGVIVPPMTNDPDHLMEVQRRARESAQRMLDSLKDAQPGTSTRFYSDGSSTEMKHKPKRKRWWRK